MATKIAGLRHNRSRYPWSKWTDGQARRATKGRDFTCSPHGFSRTLYSHASKFGYSVSVAINEKSVEFQFTKKTKR